MAILLNLVKTHRSRHGHGWMVRHRMGHIRLSYVVKLTASVTMPDDSLALENLIILSLVKGSTRLNSGLNVAVSHLLKVFKIAVTYLEICMLFAHERGLS